MEPQQQIWTWIFDCSAQQHVFHWSKGSGGEAAKENHWYLQTRQDIPAVFFTGKHLDQVWKDLEVWVELTTDVALLKHRVEDTGLEFYSHTSPQGKSGVLGLTTASRLHFLHELRTKTYKMRSFEAQRVIQMTRSSRRKKNKGSLAQLVLLVHFSCLSVHQHTRAPRTTTTPLLLSKTILHSISSAPLCKWATASVRVFGPFISSSWMDAVVTQETLMC